MRVIAGKAKRLQLKTPTGMDTRPTTDRIKETLFNMIQDELYDIHFLDMFSGSGGIGIEALSRGASYATFVDKSKDSIKLIKENSIKTKLHEKCSIIQLDYLDFIKRNVNTKYDLIFLDPPYALNMYQPALRSLLENDCLKNSTLIICESDFNDLFENDFELRSQFSIKKQSKYSKTVITILGLVDEE